jgi:hypothetical protein
MSNLSTENFVSIQPQQQFQSNEIRIDFRFLNNYGAFLLENETTVGLELSVCKFEIDQSDSFEIVSPISVFNDSPTCETKNGVFVSLDEENIETILNSIKNLTKCVH